ncbi:MAG: 4Fe-4S binding protein [Desulfarculaceae bacterium]|nr:4Fe-4S binding protein [Desulfarculaceae bacterium]MCF8071028.1 4Fe-4S binding protein [Desulfarculaceae bacterium]MCF8100616.1 4Fe-4S binding protein [Desulfarculaceae bacterium]MCF8116950.1 4Fe-4S binding protein [Desulfarculaceae bacterium]
MARNSAIGWAPEARQALQRVPALVRGLARRRVEQRVAEAGGDRVSLADFAQAEARFRAVMGGRSEKELASLMPAPNQPGAGMVVLEACRAGLSNCPNVLLDTEPWRAAVEDWLEQDNVSERLRARVDGDSVLFHHKLKIALSGCPNGCSRPQIADLALVGTTRPVFDQDACTACGLCAAACPDGAITLGETAAWDPDACQGCKACFQACPEEAISLGPAQARVLMGGKLGRHPRLAQPMAVVERPEQAVDIFRQAVDDYIDHAPPGERFAAWWARERGGI